MSEKFLPKDMIEHEGANRGAYSEEAANIEADYIFEKATEEAIKYGRTEPNKDDYNWAYHQAYRNGVVNAVLMKRARAFADGEIETDPKISVDAFQNPISSADVVKGTNIYAQGISKEFNTSHTEQVEARIKTEADMLKKAAEDRGVNFSKDMIDENGVFTEEAASIEAKAVFEKAIKSAKENGRSEPNNDDYRSASQSVTSEGVISNEIRNRARDFAKGLDAHVSEEGIKSFVQNESDLYYFTNGGVKQEKNDQAASLGVADKLRSAAEREGKKTSSERIEEIIHHTEGGKDLHVYGVGNEMIGAFVKFVIDNGLVTELAGNPSAKKIVDVCRNVDKEFQVPASQDGGINVFVEFVNTNNLWSDFGELVLIPDPDLAQGEQDSPLDETRSFELSVEEVRQIAEVEKPFQDLARDPVFLELAAGVVTKAEERFRERYRKQHDGIEWEDPYHLTTDEDVVKAMLQHWALKAIDKALEILYRNDTKAIAGEKPIELVGDKPSMTITNVYNNWSRFDTSPLVPLDSYKNDIRYDRQQFGTGVDEQDRWKVNDPNIDPYLKRDFEQGGSRREKLVIGVAVVYLQTIENIDNAEGEQQERLRQIFDESDFDDIIEKALATLRSNNIRTSPYELLRRTRR